MRGLIASIIATLAVAQPLAAEDLCVGGPRDQWLTEAEVAERLPAMGYNNAIIAVEDGCLEAKVVHDGRRIEIYMEPLTGEVVRIKEG